MRHIAFFCAIITVFVINSVVFGVNLLVPSQYANIQAAIDDANNGDTVTVADGTYTGSGNYNIDFKGKAITVISENGPVNCIIDCQNILGRRGFKFITSEDANSVLSGFTIKRGRIHSSSGDAYGGGIYCTGSSPTIENCIITSCQAYGNTGSFPSGPGQNAYGGGIYCTSNSNPVILSCTISNNTAQAGDGAVGDNPMFPPCEIPPGGGGDAYGGGIYGSSDSNIIIDRCNVTGNHAYGGEMGNPLDCPMTFPDGSGYGGGLYAKTQITNSIITDNEALCGLGYTLNRAYGGGVYLHNTSSLVNCLITDNDVFGSDVDGTGAYTTGNATIKNCTVANNTPKGIQRNGGTLTITDCIIWGNGDDLYGCSATYSCIEDGDAGVGNIAANPLFVTGPDGDYYLSQIVAGQASDSPCVDAGSNTSVNLGMNVYTTRTDGLIDLGTVDMGYHYPVVFASPDIDENWNVDFGDFAVQANQWQQSDANGLLGDITMDGFVGMDDLDILGNSWLDCYVTAASVISPGNNAAGVDPNADLSWTVGDGAASHDVYFGTDFNDVNNANTSSAEFMVTDANTTFDPGPLDANSTYSWRIDEVGPRCKAKGDVWTFTTWIEFDPNLGLINLWMFDEGEGTTAYDSVGNNNGTLVGDPCWVSGKIGPHALEFDGAGDYVDLGDLDSIVGSPTKGY
ncbi:MAG: right-handed parallel beta-helix repeat-containing protein [Planctomycetota bacterium]|jgi:hypothetical protein